MGWNDLAGKTIYADGLSSSSHYICSKLLRCSNLSENDYTLIEKVVDYDTLIRRFFTTDTIDAIFLYTAHPNPFIDSIKTKPIKIITLSGLHKHKISSMFPLMKPGFIDISKYDLNEGKGDMVKTMGSQSLILTHKDIETEYICIPSLNFVKTS